jgi:hypothetical protein
MLKVLWFLFLLMPTLVLADDLTDVIQMKNGDVYRGQIIDQQFNQFIQIRFTDGNEKRIQWSEVKNVKREKSYNSVSIGTAKNSFDNGLDSPYSEPAKKTYTEGPAAEPSHSPRFRIAPGISLSTLATTSTSSVASMGLGFKFGVASETMISNSTSLYGGLEFMSRITEVSSNSSSSQGDITLNYLVIPLLMRAHFDRFAIGAGPYLGINLSAKGTVGGTSSDLEVDDTDLGLRAYGTYDFEIETSGFIGLGYDFGLTNLNESGSISTENRTLFFDIGVRI